MYDYKKMKSEMFEGDNTSKHLQLYTSVVSVCIRKVTFTIGDILNEVCGSSLEVMCCMEFMEELGFLREIYALGSMTQDRRFVLLM